MNIIEIKNWITGAVMFAVEAVDLITAIQKLVKDGANLDGANLVRANLDGANLYGANLVRANLDGANLDGANLVRANLDGANLDGADGELHPSMARYFRVSGMPTTSFRLWRAAAPAASITSGPFASGVTEP